MVVLWAYNIKQLINRLTVITKFISCQKEFPKRNEHEGWVSKHGTDIWKLKTWDRNLKTEHKKTMGDILTDKKRNGLICKLESD